MNALRAAPCGALEDFKALDALDSDQRIPVLDALCLLSKATQNGQDPALGLRAALALEPGDLGAVEYTVSSEATVLCALNALARYVCLLSEATTVSSDVIEDSVFVRLESALVLPRPALEFQLGALLRLQSRAWPDVVSSELQVWLSTPCVASMDDYQRVFAPARLHFGAAFVGFAFPARHLELPLKTYDAKLNCVVRRHVELELGKLQRHTHSEQVRSLLIRELPSRRATLKTIARLMRTSVSTLGRRLDEEGTCFATIREEQRRSLALSYLSATELSVAEISDLAGFAHVTAFRRAFKRWTGKSPQQYREQQHAWFRAPLDGREPGTWSGRPV